MSSWNQHLFLNKQVNYWKTREITEQEKQRLYIKSILNYQGYWINGIIHTVPLYMFYKRGFLSKSSNFNFWKNIVSLLVVCILSKSQIDHVINLSLGFEIQSLAYKYESPKDEIRKKYHSEKSKLDMLRVMKYEELREKGKAVEDIININSKNR